MPSAAQYYGLAGSAVGTPIAPSRSREDSSLSTHRKSEPPRNAEPPKKEKRWNRALSKLRKAGPASRKTALSVGVAILILIVLVIVVSFFIDEPLRRQMERRMNQSLKGYTVQIPKLHFSLFGLSITLHDLTLRQQANPDPPVMVVPKLKASVQWSELVTLHLVADFLFDKPRVHVNLGQLRAEYQDPVPVKDKGWQDALEQIYPLKINLFRVDDGNFVYIDEDPKKPLRISHLSFRANNIRNIHSRDHVYPSQIRAEGVIFESGRGVLDGHADFLAKPFPGVHALFRVEKVPLDSLRPLSARANLSLRGGTLDTHGEIEYAPKAKNVRVDDLAIKGVHLDYIHTAATAQAETARKEKVATAAKKATNRQDMNLRLDHFEIVDSNIGWVNKAKNPPYRVFVSNTNATITNLSNQFRNGPAVVRASGRFQGSGSAKATATFRPEKNGPDFELSVAIEDTQMTAMNDLLRAYGKFDVVAGVFSFYTELRVKNGQIQGYVKPLFKDMKVYDKRQDAEKSAFRKLYEKLVGGVSKLLENKRNEVATKADISGPVSSPSSSILQVIGRLIENAFFRAILPGFDQELFHMGKGPKPAKDAALKPAKS